MTILLTLLALAAGVALVAAWAYICGWRGGRRFELNWMRREAEERKRAEFRFAAHDHSELAQARLLHAATEVDRLDALLSGDHWGAYDCRVRASHLAELIHELEGDPVNAYEQLGALVNHEASGAMN